VLIAPIDRDRAENDCKQSQQVATAPGRIEPAHGLTGPRQNAGLVPVKNRPHDHTTLSGMNVPNHHFSYTAFFWSSMTIILCFYLIFGFLLAGRVVKDFLARQVANNVFAFERVFSVHFSR
jgi:hypothetical protein